MKLQMSECNYVLSCYWDLLGHLYFLREYNYLDALWKKLNIVLFYTLSMQTFINCSNYTICRRIQHN